MGIWNKKNVKDLCEGFRHIEFPTNENDDVNHDNVDGWWLFTHSSLNKKFLTNKKKLTNIMIGEKKIEFIMIHTYQSYIKWQ